jgi:Mn-dependent DtxR family transcriptional regulator
MNVSGNRLAEFLGVSARTVGRLERDGLLERQRDGTFALQHSVQRLLSHFMVRERWAFQRLARFRIFDERSGDVFEPRRHR